MFWKNFFKKDNVDQQESTNMQNNQEENRDSISFIKDMNSQSNTNNTKSEIINDTDNQEKQKNIFSFFKKKENKEQIINIEQNTSNNEKKQKKGLLGFLSQSNIIYSNTASQLKQNPVFKHLIKEMIQYGKSNEENEVFYTYQYNNITIGLLYNDPKNIYIYTDKDDDFRHLETIVKVISLNEEITIEEVRDTKKILQITISVGMFSLAGFLIYELFFSQSKIMLPTSKPPPPKPITMTPEQQNYYKMIMSRNIIAKSLVKLNNLYYTYPFKVVDFTIQGNANTTTVTYTASFTLYYNYPASDTKYNSNVNAYEKIYKVSVNAHVVNPQPTTTTINKTNIKVTPKVTQIPSGSLNLKPANVEPTHYNITMNGFDLEKVPVNLQTLENKNNIDSCLQQLYKLNFMPILRDTDYIDFKNTKPVDFTNLLNVLNQCPLYIEHFDKSNAILRLFY